MPQCNIVLAASDIMQLLKKKVWDTRVDLAYLVNDDDAIRESAFHIVHKCVFCDNPDSYLNTALIIVTPTLKL